MVISEWVKKDQLKGTKKVAGLCKTDLNDWKAKAP